MVAMMLLTGVANTLLTKWQDKQCMVNCDQPDPSKRKYFSKPVYQTAQMFVGEAGCWLVVAVSAFHRRFVRSRAGYEPIVVTDNSDSERTGLTASRDDTGNRHRTGLGGSRLLLLSLPAICDILSTTLMHVGLLLVTASTCQMTRGALVLFIGLFSVFFLHRRLHLYQWLSLVGIVAGVAIVGLASIIYPEKQVANMGEMGQNPETDASSDTARALVGILLIAGAQIFTATQFVLEEWILHNSNFEPVNVVSWEGAFGLVITVLFLLFMHLVVGRTPSGTGGLFDAAEGWHQMTSSPGMVLSSILIMLSIGGFNFFGVSMTRNVSATSRSTIDTSGTLFIWIVLLGIGWETFKWLQVVGFALLVYFTFLFNGIVHPPFKWLQPRDEEIEEAIPEEPIEYR